MKFNKNYEKKFYQNLEKVRVLAIITIILELICVFSEISLYFINDKHSIFFKFNLAWLSTFYLVPFLFSIKFVPKTIPNNVDITKKTSDYCDLLWNIISNFIPIVFLILPGGAYILGAMFLFYIPMYIANIFLIENLKIIKNEIKRSTFEYDQQKKIEKREKAEQKRIINILDRIGVKFFVNNFHAIKNYSLIDAIDSIDNKLPYEEKKERVQCGKAIFEEGLEITTLHLITNDNTYIIDESTKEKIFELLKNG